MPGPPLRLGSPQPHAGGASKARVTGLRVRRRCRWQCHRRRRGPVGLAGEGWPPSPAVKGCPGPFAEHTPCARGRHRQVDLPTPTMLRVEGPRLPGSTCQRLGTHPSLRRLWGVRGVGAGSLKEPACSGWSWGRRCRGERRQRAVRASPSRVREGRGPRGPSHSRRFWRDKRPGKQSLKSFKSTSTHIVPPVSR